MICTTTAVGGVLLFYCGCADQSDYRADCGVFLSVLLSLKRLPFEVFYSFFRNAGTPHASKRPQEPHDLCEHARLLGY